MSTCVAHGCANKPWRKMPGTTFHRFPKDEKLKTMWVLAVRRKNWTPSPLSTLCSKHFTEDMIDRSSLLCVRLKENAVPTIFNYPSNDKEVSQRSTEKSATNSKTGKTVAAPLSVKKGIIPSVLPTTSLSAANRDVPLEEKQRLEAERLAHALRESLENASEDFFHLDFNTGATSNTSDLRLSENKRKKEVQTKTAKKQKLDDVLSNNHDISSVNPDANQQRYSNGVQNIAENINSNDKHSNSSTVMSQIQVKKEEPWEAGYKISSDTSKNNSVENTTADNVQITSVISLSSESNGDIVAEENTTKKPQEQLDSTFYTKPLNIDGRDKSFGNFIACEISDLHGNPEIYMKTKQKIIEILAEAHFEQINLNKKSLPAEPVLKTKL